APDAPAPVDTDTPPAPQQALKVGYTQRVWDAIRAENVDGNAALDSLALSAPVN
ncbi:resuscitation-promoting factor rpfA, partial [Mycobacterium tuberculosis variant microti OV254]